MSINQSAVEKVHRHSLSIGIMYEVQSFIVDISLLSCLAITSILYEEC